MPEPSHVVHRGIEGLTGRKHEKDSWDKYIEEQEKTFGDPTAVGLLKFIVDGYSLGYGWEMVRITCDPFLELAAGDTKKAGKGFEYMGADVVEHLIGPFYSDIFSTAQEITRIGQIEAGQRNPLLKPKKIKKSVGKYIEGQIPALRQFPQFESAFGIKPPPK